MAGLAAALDAPDSIDALAWALSARGADGAVCHLAGAEGTDLDIGIRAAMPAIPRVVAADAPEDAAPIAAFVIDGIASVTALDQGYAAYGPSGLVNDGTQPYAVILADAERDELVLARNGDGPGLYYARLGGGWVAASEPGALIHAGVGAEPDGSVVRHFIATGACDDAERTFFARIRRVLPGEAVVLAVGRAPERVDTGWTRKPVPTELALQDATNGPRVGVLVAPGLPGAAALGTALSQPGGPRPLPVHTAAWAGLDGPAADQPAVLVPLAHDAVRYAGHTVAGTRADLDRALTEFGEPVPDIGLILTWAVVRDLGSEIDTLVDSAVGGHIGVERVCDRLLARYGVNVRFPLRESESDVDEFGPIAGRTLPSPIVRTAGADPARRATAAEVVIALGDDVAAALVKQRPWSDPSHDVAALRRLHAGVEADAEALLRAYLVERWLAGLGWQHEGPTQLDTSGDQVAEIAATAVAAPVTMGGEEWLRVPIRTNALTPGEPIAAPVAWHVANLLAARPELAAGSWYVTVAGKAVSVSQNRVKPLLDLVPGRVARVLARLGRRRLPQLAEAWTMQVAIDHCGLGRVASAVLLGIPLGPDGALYPPRPDAVGPADSAVVRAPFEPDEVAATIADAVRKAVAPSAAETLIGCAVVSADERGCRLLGFASGSGGDLVPRPRRLLALLLADNPAGQGGERTPFVVVASALYG